MTSTIYTIGQFPAGDYVAAEVRITKFDGCVRGIIHDANIAPRYATIQGFEKLANVRATTALISARPVRAAVAA